MSTEERREVKKKLRREVLARRAALTEPGTGERESSHYRADSGTPVVLPLGYDSGLCQLRK